MAKVVLIDSWIVHLTPDAIKYLAEQDGIKEVFFYEQNHFPDGHENFQITEYIRVGEQFARKHPDRIYAFDVNLAEVGKSFRVNKEELHKLWKEHECTYTDFGKLGDDRTNPKLIELVEKFGNNLTSEPNEVRIVEVPDDVEWHIEHSEEMHNEWVAENHRTWG